MQPIIIILVGLAAAAAAGEAVFTQDEVIAHVQRLIESGGTAEAVELARSLADQAPGSATALGVHGIALHAAGDLPGALAALADASVLPGASGWLRANHGRLLWEAGRAAEAAPLLERVVAEWPAEAASARTWNNLGLSYNSLGRHPEAVAAYARAEALDPGFNGGELPYNMAVSLKR